MDKCLLQPPYENKKPWFAAQKRLQEEMGFTTSLFTKAFEFIYKAFLITGLQNMNTTMHFVATYDGVINLMKMKWWILFYEYGWIKKITHSSA